jgi:hypothetical protein
MGVAMAVTGNALKLRTELAALMRRHNIVQQPHSIPLAAPTQCPMVLTGFASTGDLDFDRCRFASFAFGLLHKSKTRLLYAHDELAGEVEELSYDPYGRLLIKCRVDHAQARRCNGFSVGGRIRAYKLVDTDKPSFHAVIEDCELAEVSLVENPSNRFALVRSRFPADARSKFLGDLSKWAATLTQMVELLPQVAAKDHHCLEAGGDLTAARRKAWPQRGDLMIGAVIGGGILGGGRRQPPARGSFSELAAELNNRSA